MSEYSEHETHPTVERMERVAKEQCDSPGKHTTGFGARKVVLVGESENAVRVDQVSNIEIRKT